jgi:SOS-response transcriptional repressor LexA
VGIEEGDLLLLEPVTLDEAPDGSLLAVRQGPGRPTFRRLARNGRGVYLQSLAVGARPELVEEPGRLSLVGRVAGLYRRLEGPDASVSLTAH